MSEEDQKKPGIAGDHYHNLQHQPPPPPQPQYGTFQGVANYPPPLPPQHHQPAIGFPQPVPPPGVADPSAPPAAHHPEYYTRGYQTVPGYAVAEGRPVRERRLPCCGIGIGWFLFIIGFFLAGVPWYAGALIMLCSRIDYREKPGHIACTVASHAVAMGLGFGKSRDDILTHRCRYPPLIGQGFGNSRDDILTQGCRYPPFIGQAILATIAIVLGVTKGADDW
ncbi:hypothetical protein TIFTF001_026902 [Ficus carica]|uniref:60S ribosomal protein L18a-like protein n=1 Tax=Ficus carica TaxID=3494 RepID=A0AA88IXM3_FICCA|nr:hypothetical protein TIFTF001_026902 [Ficus carica]